MPDLPPLSVRTSSAPRAEVRAEVPRRPSYLGKPRDAFQPGPAPASREQVPSLHLGPPQREVIRVVRALGADFSEVVRGAHVIIENDQGAIYDHWRRYHAFPRVSSHYPRVLVAQYEIPFGPGAVLFGKVQVGDTWFQMESHSVGGGALYVARHPSLLVAHMEDYLRYRQTHENVGLIGKSKHTQDNPLRIPFDPSVLPEDERKGRRRGRRR